MPLYTRFRLLVALPVRVDFPSITYTLEPETIFDGHGIGFECRLSASLSPGVAYLCAIAKNEQDLSAKLAGPGVEIRCKTVPHLIFERLVREKRAAQVQEPAVAP